MKVTSLCFLRDGEKRFLVDNDEFVKRTEKITFHDLVGTMYYK